MVEFPAMATPEKGPRLNIRAARAGDAPGIREIFNEAVEDRLATFETELRGLEEQRLLLEAAEHDPKHPILVAELRGWTAGWAALQSYDSRIQLDDLGEVLVYVRRSFRSYGIGRQLMQAIQTIARSLGYRKLIGQVLAENRDSLRLCRSTGWREVGRHLQHAPHRDTYRDVVVVEYLISSPSSSAS